MDDRMATMAVEDDRRVPPPVQPRAMAVGERRALTEEEVAHFDLVAPSTARRARLRAVPVLPPGAAGMTLGRWVLLRRGHERRHALIAHELVHVEQWHGAGRAGFLRAYLRSYLGSRRRGATHRAAYLAIPAEAEARERTAVWSARYWL
jgi:hypothetical protein